MPTAGAEVGGATGCAGSRPIQRGLRQMITAMPHAVTRSSIAMKARSFCFADGPRGRTTSVGVLPRRALIAFAPGGTSGRSGMRIVICAAARGFIGGVANGGGALAVCGPDPGCPMSCGPDGARPPPIGLLAAAPAMNGTPDCGV